jgi:hypothetical protein
MISKEYLKPDIFALQIVFLFSQTYGEIIEISLTFLHLGSA